MITINKTSLQQATAVELRALEAGLAGVNRTRDTPQGPEPLANVGEYLEHYINEVLLPQLIQQEPASSEKVKEITELLASVPESKRDAVLASLKS